MVNDNATFLSRCMESRYFTPTTGRLAKTMPIKNAILSQSIEAALIDIEIDSGSMVRLRKHETTANEFDGATEVGCQALRVSNIWTHQDGSTDNETRLKIVGPDRANAVSPEGFRPITGTLLTPDACVVVWHSLRMFHQTKN